MSGLADEQIYTPAELSEQLSELLKLPGFKEQGKGAIDLHSNMLRAKHHHEEHPEEPFDEDLFYAIAKTLLHEVFRIEGPEPH